MKPQILDDDQLASVFLAGLRSLQESLRVGSTSESVNRILEDSGQQDMDSDLLDLLCEDLSCGDIRVTAHHDD